MDSEFWRERWRDGQIGFHEGRVNKFLERYIDRLDGRRRVLVPLCGKAEDLAFLAACRHHVVGVELVEDAVRAFFEAHNATLMIAPVGPFVEYATGSITVFAGDWFDTTAELLGPIDAVYDRAALIALPPELRARYVTHLRRVVPAGTLVLVVTLEYPPGALAGPPFAVAEDELHALYEDATIELLDEEPATHPRADAPLIERCYAITL